MGLVPIIKPPTMISNNCCNINNVRGQLVRDSRIFHTPRGLLFEVGGVYISFDFGIRTANCLLLLSWLQKSAEISCLFKHAKLNTTRGISFQRSYLLINYSIKC